MGCPTGIAVVSASDIPILPAMGCPTGIAVVSASYIAAEPATVAFLEVATAITVVAPLRMHAVAAFAVIGRNQVLRFSCSVLTRVQQVIY
jgi:hypothetical protein